MSGSCTICRTTAAVSRRSPASAVRDQARGTRRSAPARAAAPRCARTGQARSRAAAASRAAPGTAAPPSDRARSLRFMPMRAQHRRVQQHLDARVLAELGVQPSALDRVEVQPRDLVLVLVGHQLEEAVGVGLGDLDAAGAEALLHDRGDALHVGAKVGGVAGVLVGGELALVALEQVGERALAIRGAGVRRRPSRPRDSASAPAPAAARAARPPPDPSGTRRCWPRPRHR